MDILTDAQIQAFLAERKRLPADWRTRLLPSSHANSDSLSGKLEVDGDNGNRFRLWTRTNPFMPLDFSIGLMLIRKSQLVMLARYNGRHPSEHTNKVERDRGDGNCRFRDKFHIHKATQRYQESGYDIVGYAEVTAKYSAFGSALTAMLVDNGFMFPGDMPGQARLAFDNE